MYINTFQERDVYGCPYGAKKGNTEKELSIISQEQKEFICKLFKESYDVLGVKY